MIVEGVQHGVQQNLTMIYGKKNGRNGNLNKAQQIHNPENRPHTGQKQQTSQMVDNSKSTQILNT